MPAFRVEAGIAVPPLTRATAARGPLDESATRGHQAYQPASETLPHPVQRRVQYLALRVEHHWSKWTCGADEPQGRSFGDFWVETGSERPSVVHDPHTGRSHHRGAAAANCLAECATVPSVDSARAPHAGAAARSLCLSCMSQICPWCLRSDATAAFMLLGEPAETIASNTSTATTETNRSTPGRRESRGRKRTERRLAAALKHRLQLSGDRPGPTAHRPAESEHGNAPASVPTGA